MGRRNKKGRAVSGWLILDKDYDLGSTTAVAIAKRLFGAQKAGHAGTLDPLATGVLPIALGEATKTAAFVTDAQKRYRFTARWGTQTSTDDAEGEVIASSDTRPSEEDILGALGDFTGVIEQVPPKFSAIKVNGERAYDMARDGEDVELAAREIDIHELKLVEILSDDEAVFEAATGKGAYVRALVRDLAIALGAHGHVSALRRTAVGPFHADDAVTVAELEEIGVVEDRDGVLTPIADALTDMPHAVIDGPQADKLRRGQAAILSPPSAKGLRGDASGEIAAVLAMLHDDPVAICALDGLKLKPFRVFNL